MQMVNNTIQLPKKITVETVSDLFNQIKSLGKNRPIEFDCKKVEFFDSSAIVFFNILKKQNFVLSFINLKPEFKEAFSIFPVIHLQEEDHQKPSPLKKRVENIGTHWLAFKKSFQNFLILLSDEAYHTFQFLMKGRGVYPGEIMNQVFFMGYKSFPIVTLIVFLVGITISITAAEQLHNFGADIYLADLVGFGMIRELVPLMTGIILAGKIGAAITAEISSMKVLEETDALKTMGIIPEKFLMVPRLIAISLAVPLLVVVADFVGILAGILVAKMFSGITPTAFFNEMLTVVDLGDVLIGLSKTMVFGWLVVLSAGFKGFSVERGAEGVGIATTESVVLSISLIIVFNCIFALILY
jgi:phospholipid/cholesterol/gamma-HCH transport system permease protein